jgi:DNA-binding transcriptional ArsR family regulator
MPNKPAALESVFRALADPTRLKVLGRLSRSPAPVGELAKLADMALPSFLQHLDMLEKAGLIRSEKKGRVRICEIEPTQLNAAEAWLTQVRAVWSMRQTIAEARRQERLADEARLLARGESSFGG